MFRAEDGSTSSIWLRSRPRLSLPTHEFGAGVQSTGRSEYRAFRVPVRVPGVQSTDFSRLPAIFNHARSTYRAFRVPTLVGSLPYSTAAFNVPGVQSTDFSRLSAIFNCGVHVPGVQSTDFSRLPAIFNCGVHVPGVQSTDFSRLSAIFNHARSTYRAFRVPTLVGSLPYSTAAFNVPGVQSTDFSRLSRIHAFRIALPD